MEAYPEAYVAHNFPLLVLSGLPQVRNDRASSQDMSAASSGTRLTSDLPSLTGSNAEQLREEFLRLDGASLPWSEHGQSERAGLIGFNIVTTGRNFSLPSRKAAPPPIAPNLSPPQSPTPGHASPLELHSPLSPLSPTSPIFPDGLMTPLWLAKHQDRIPSVFLSFHCIDSDPAQSTLQDNQLKTDINTTKNVLAKSGFKTRLAVILVAEKVLLGAPEIEDRIAAIKRATGLDAKSALFFLPPPSSETDLSSFVVNVLTALQPVCIDYYRDLTKHARRKKSRGYAPPPTSSARGTSQTLTLHGWNVRYDFKLAVFAEFRQEMDVAQRHYESALEELFDPEGNLETTPSWSPRWNDCRLLCDVIAFRILRCQIWRGMTSSAGESWCNYKYRMRDLIDRRGKGTDGYGWEAWQARWAKMMAQLIEMAELPVYRPLASADGLDGSQPSLNAIYAPPEKAYSTMDRMPPFHLLHHAGYWWRMVSKHVVARRRKAEAIPVEDRSPPEELSAAQAASRAREYDMYLVPAPHQELPTSGHASYDYLLDVQSQTERAESEFQARDQTRAVQHLKLELARELIRAKRYNEALNSIWPAWDDMKWRREGWFHLAAEVLQLTYQCAVRVGDKRLVVEVAWEMTCHVLQFNNAIDLLQVLGALGESEADTLVSLSSQTRLSPVDLSFAFNSSEGFVGESAPAQIVVKFNASEQTSSVCLSELSIHFGNNFRSLEVSHADSTNNVFSTLTELREEHDPSHPMAKTLRCSADLRFRPGQTRVLNVSIPLREADTLKTTGATVMLSQKTAAIEYLYSRPADIRAQNWLWPSGEGIAKRRICREVSSAITVLPKPPKMQIRIVNPKDQYFASEQMLLGVEISNEEDEDADVTLTAKLQDEADSVINLAWQIGDEEAEHNGNGVLEVGRVASSKSVLHQLLWQAPPEPSNYILSITASYRLESTSNADAALSKTLSVGIPFVGPFEANYDFGPRLHLKDYPDFFLLPGVSTTGGQIAQGIEQKWCLTSRVVSFASEALVVESTSIEVNKTSSNTVCILDDADQGDPEPRLVDARGTMNVSHVIDTRKYSIEDRRTAALDLSLAINWRRRDADSKSMTRTLLAVPNLTVPAAEPRVLCTAHKLNSDTDIMKIRYTIENPSIHFLNFALTMEASDAFAFSGSKFRSVSLTPMSRVSVEYNILVYETEDEEKMTELDGQSGWWIWPMLRVTDPYFNRSLRVLDAGEGITSDERGNIGIWVVAK